MRYLGGRWSLLLALYILPRFVRDWGYDAVARRRYRIWGKYDACPIPPPGVRDRFLD
jgi:predicted DCC family thiol-disulfide oxidoreductase YuxK